MSDGETSNALSRGAIISGRYHLDEDLTRGGMGWLWIATDQRLHRQVVLKFILSRSSAGPSPVVLARFEREACAAAKLQSPHIVQIHDFGSDLGHAYIVMELLHGEDLGKRLDRVTRLPLEDVGRVVRDTCAGLKMIHGAGMLHRDVKPGNLFLTTVDGAEIVKIIDFGVVRTPDAKRLTFGPVGTARYMSPEAFGGSQPLDARADLWSLAVIAYRALTGRLPFEPPVLTAKGLEVRDTAPADPTSLVAGLPTAVDTFFRRALAKAPDARFASAEEMAAAFAETGRQAARTTARLGTPSPALRALAARQAAATIPTPEPVTPAPTPPAPATAPEAAVETAQRSMERAVPQTEFVEASPAPASLRPVEVRAPATRRLLYGLLLVGVTAGVMRLLVGSWVASRSGSSAAAAPLAGAHMQTVAASSGPAMTADRSEAEPAATAQRGEATSEPVVPPSAAAPPRPAERQSVPRSPGERRHKSDDLKDPFSH